jgi:hypothetical protein
MLPIMSWDQLATAVRARRTELGLTQVDVAAAGHVSVDMIRNIEHRRRTPKRVNPRTARAIEDALEWEPGSVESTLAGGTPTPVTHESRHPPRQATLEPGAAVGQPLSAALHGAGNATAPALVADPGGDAPPRIGAGDQFAFARQIVALRSTLSEHQRSISSEARTALMAEVASSAREAEEAIVRMMHWLGDDERGEAIALLVKLREPLP